MLTTKYTAMTDDTGRYLRITRVHPLSLPETFDVPMPIVLSIVGAILMRGLPIGKHFAGIKAEFSHRTSDADVPE